MKKSATVSIVAIISLFIAFSLHYLLEEGNPKFSFVGLSSNIASYLEELLPEPTQLTDAEKAAIEEDIRQNTKVIKGKDFKYIEYTRWIWESPQKNFGIFHNQGHMEKWGNYNTESSKTEIGISFNITSGESSDSRWVNRSAPIMPKEALQETMPANYKWESWDTMWGPQKSQ